MSVIAIDIGTSTLKAVRANRFGEVIAALRLPTSTHRPSAGVVEFPVDDIASACLSLIGELAVKPGEDAVEAIVFSCLGTSMAPIDREDNVLAAALSPLDSRSEPRASLPAGWTGAGLRRITGQNPSTASFMHQWSWWRAMADRFPRGTTFLSIRGYLVRVLCGVTAEDDTFASRSMLWDLEAGRWCAPLCEAIGLDPEFLPPVYPATTSWRISDRWIEELGVSPDCSIVLGAMDNSCAVLGSSTPGQQRLVNILGSFNHMAVAAEFPRAVEALSLDIDVIVFRYILDRQFLICTRDPTGYLLERISERSGVPVDELSACEPKEREPAEQQSVEAPSEEALSKRLAAGATPCEVAGDVIEAAYAGARRFVSWWSTVEPSPFEVAASGGGAVSGSAIERRAAAIGCRFVRLRHREASALGALRVAAMATRQLSVAEACRLIPNPIVHTANPRGVARVGGAS